MAKRKSKFENFKKRFSKSLDYLVETRRYIYFVSIIFAFSTLVGFFFAERFSFIEDVLREILRRVAGLGTFDLITFIFQNNVQSAFYSLIFGIILGILPVLNAIGNGLVLGYVFEGLWQVSGFKDFWRILPHGIFELVAIFISLGLGVRLGMFVFEKNRWKVLKDRLINSLIIFLMVVVPLLVLAAIVEGILIGVMR